MTLEPARLDDRSGRDETCETTEPEAVDPASGQHPFQFTLASDDHRLSAGLRALLAGQLDRKEIKEAIDINDLDMDAVLDLAIERRDELLSDVGPAYEEYQRARSTVHLWDTWRPASVVSPRGQPGVRAAQAALQRLLGRVLRRWLPLGAAATLVGFVLGGWWSDARALGWAGLAVMAVAGVGALAIGVVRTPFGAVTAATFWLHGARSRLLQHLRTGTRPVTLLVPFLRTIVNQARRGRFKPDFSVRDSTGLSEVHDPSFTVPTVAAAELEQLLDRLQGGSIGIAGSRGTGKSTLIRQHCQPDDPTWVDVPCLVSAPVNYEARDFVMHMFAEFCRKVGQWARYNPYEGRIERFRSNLLLALRLLASGAMLAGMVALIAAAYRPPELVIDLPPVQWLFGEEDSRGGIRWVLGGAAVFVAVLIVENAVKGLLAWRGARRMVAGRLAGQARRQLRRVRYLQTHTTGWSGGLSLPVAQGLRTRAATLTEQPLSYPEIVERFRALARSVAEPVQEARGRVLIGVDELDKIGSAEQAEQFLNEIKGVFGVPNVYFLVTISDEALTAFERRGLPLRDAFDSSFDEIIRVAPLTYHESLRLLNRRVIGLNEPYVGLCHCLAGGLARDLIRAARQTVRVGEGINREPNPEWPYLGRKHPRLAEIAPKVIRDEVGRKAYALEHVAARLAGANDSHELLMTLHQVARHPAAANLHHLAHEVMDHPTDSESRELTAMRQEWGTYLYFAATLEDVFGDALDDQRMLAATGRSDQPGGFDVLAGARHAFSLSAGLAFRLVDDFRREWRLSTWHDR